METNGLTCLAFQITRYRSSLSLRVQGPEKVPWFIYNNTKINPDDHPSCAKYYSGATTGYPRIQHPVYPVSNTAFPYSWNHEGKSSAIIGGVFVPGGWFAEGKGKDCYVIADFVRSGVYCLPWDYGEFCCESERRVSGRRSIHRSG